MSSTPAGTAAASSPPGEARTLVGTSLGKYRIARLVGRGGMGQVYEAVNSAIGKRVALKCIDAELAQSADTVARFQREAMAASAVDSPYIVQIFDAGEDAGTPYIVMELLRGRDLAALLAEHSPLRSDEAVMIARQVLKGLSRAHQAGIVHRDLKPDNVFLVEDEGEPARVKLLDFGVSKMARSSSGVALKTLTKQGTVVGTPHYMSPEQAQALLDVDERTDLYSLGALLYECLAGVPPHSGDSYEQVIVNICMHDARDVREHNPLVPDALAEAIHKALARERDERFADAPEMLSAFEKLGPSASSTGLRLASRETPAADQLPLASQQISGVKPLLSHDQDDSEENDSEEAPFATPLKRNPAPLLLAALALIAVIALALGMRKTAPATTPRATGAEIPREQAQRAGTSPPSAASDKANTTSSSANAAVPPAAPKTTKSNPALRKTNRHPSPKTAPRQPPSSRSAAPTALQLPPPTPPEPAPATSSKPGLELMPR